MERLKSKLEVRAFLDWIERELKPAEVALHNGDAAPRRRLWSRREPITVLGAWRNAVGLAEVDALFDYLGRSFSNCVSFDIEVLACDVVGEMAYTVCREHTSASVNGTPRTYSLRVTQTYRFEDGAWRVAHRHGDAGVQEQV